MQIGLDHTRVDVQPGRPARLAVDLHNERQGAAMYSLSIEVPGTAWLTGAQPVVRVSHAETVTVGVDIHVGRDVVAGEHDAVLIAVSTSDPADVAVQRLRLVVAAAPGLRLMVAPSVVSGHAGADTTATVVNTGNTALDVALSTQDPAGEIQSRLSVVNTRLLAGERRDVDMSIVAPSRRVGAPVRRLVGVSAVADDGVVAEEFVTFMHRPRLGRRVVRAFAAVVVVVAAVGSALMAAGVFDRDVAGKRVAPGFHARDVVDQPTSTVSGRVVSESVEEPLGAVLVTVGRDLGDGSVAVVSTTSTDAEGVWEVSGVTGGTHVFTFSRPGFDVIEVTEVVVPAVDRDLEAVVLPGRAATVTLAVRVAAPAEVVQFELRSIGGVTTRGEAIVGSDGVAPIRIEGVESPMEQQLRVTADSHLAQTVTFTTSAGDVIDLPPVRLLAAPATMRGRVVNVDEKPLGGVTVDVVIDGVRKRVISDSVSGTWVVDELHAPRDAAVTFQADGYAVISRSVAVEPSVDLNLDDVVLVAAQGVVSGQVLSADGVPINGARVVVRGRDDDRVTTTARAVGGDGSAGSFTVSGVPSPGSYTVEVSAPGFLRSTVGIDLTPTSNPAQLSVVLRPAVVTLTGDVIVDGVGTGGVTVTLDDGRVVRTATSADTPVGTFTFADVPAGLHTVSATLRDGRTATVLVDVALGPSPDVDLVIGDGVS